MPKPSALSIQSIGPPPERHADRIVAEMLRQLAVQKAERFPMIADAMLSSRRDGGPRAQRRMAERAGAISTYLSPGKRGSYEFMFCDLAGWDVTRNAEITPQDQLPAKPWLVGFVNVLTSLGRGREQRDFKSSPILFVTHHALSRVAQRFGATHSHHLLNLTTNIFNQLMDEQMERGKAGTLRQWLDAVPPEGYRMPVADVVTVVLKRHQKYKGALVAATIFKNNDDVSQKDL
jgi:hypothetical protein